MGARGMFICRYVIAVPPCPNYGEGEGYLSGVGGHRNRYE